MRFLYSQSFLDAHARLSEEQKDIFAELIQEQSDRSLACTAKITQTCFAKLPHLIKLNICRGIWIVFSCGRRAGSAILTLRFWSIERPGREAEGPWGGPFIGTTLREVERFTRWSFNHCPPHYFSKERGGAWTEGLRWFRGPTPGQAQLFHEQIRSKKHDHLLWALGPAGPEVPSSAQTSLGIRPSSSEPRWIESELPPKPAPHALTFFQAALDAVNETPFVPTLRVGRDRFRQLWEAGPFAHLPWAWAWQVSQTWLYEPLPHPKALLTAILDRPWPLPWGVSIVVRLLLADWARGATPLPVLLEPARALLLAWPIEIDKEKEAQCREVLTQVCSIWEQEPSPTPIHQDTFTRLLGPGALCIELYQGIQWYRASLKQSGGWDDQDLAWWLLTSGQLPHEPAHQPITLPSCHLLSRYQRLALLLQAAKPSDVEWYFGEGLWSDDRQDSEAFIADFDLVHRTVLYQSRSVGTLAAFRSAVRCWLRMRVGMSPTPVLPPRFHSGRLVTVARGLTLDDLDPQTPATILVRSDADAALVRQQNPGWRVVTLAQSENQCFDAVVIWRFFEDAPWTELQTADGLTDQVAALTDLYEGLARARCEALIFEGAKPLPIWDHPVFQEWVFVTEDRTLARSHLEPLRTEKAWSHLASIYDDAGLLQAAEACYRQANDRLEAQVKRGQQLQRDGRFEEAALAFKKIGRIDRAAFCYEKVENYQAALLLWNRAKDQQAVLRCRLGLLVCQGRYQAAARIYERQEDFRNAVALYRRAGMFRKAAVLAQQRLLDNAEAAALYELGEDWALSARLWEKVGDLNRAYTLYVRAQEPAHAQRILQKQGDVEGIQTLFKEMGRSPKLLTYFEKNRDTEKCLSLLEHWSPDVLRHEAERAISQRKYYQAYVRYRVLGDHQGIGLAAYRLKNYQEAGEAYLLAGLRREAANAYRMGQLWHAAFLTVFEGEEDLPTFYRSRRLYTRLEDRTWITQQAFRFLRQKDYLRAGFLFWKLELYLQYGECRLSLGHVDEAIVIWTDITDIEHLNYVAKVSLGLNLLDIGIRLVIDLLPCFQEWRRGRFNPKIAPYVFQLVARYFESHEDSVRLKIWANRLLERDRLGQNAYLTFTYLERSQHVRELLQHLCQWHRMAHVWALMTSQFLRDLSEGSSYSTAGLALRAYALADQGQLIQALQDLHIGADHDFLFLLTDFGLDEINTVADPHYPLWECPERRAMALHLAQTAVAQKHAKRAAVYFLQAGSTQEALSQAQNQDDRLLLAAAFTQDGAFTQALAIMETLTSVPPELYGRVYEGLAQYEEAAFHYGQAQDSAAVLRCRRLKRQQDEAAFPRFY